MLLLSSVGLFLAAVLGHVVGQSSAPCEKPVVDYTDVDGETYGLVSLSGTGVQTAGGYTFYVRLHTPFIRGGPALIRGRVQSLDGGLTFRVQLPSQNPRSTIKMIRFNGNVICESEAPFEGTTSEYTLRVSSGPRNPSTAQRFDKPESEERLFPQIPRPTAPPPTSRPATPTTATSVKVSCGVQSKPTVLIFGGKDTERGDWPWLAALIRKEDMNFFCGSTLISNQHVITAAHCMIVVKTKQQLKKENIIVAAGKYDIFNWFEGEVQYKQVRKMFVHEDYDRITLQNDITILLLDSKVKYTQYVRPICLWTQKTDLNLILNRNATVVGWGRTETSDINPSNIPLLAAVPIVDTQMCTESHVGISTNVNPELAICAGAKNGVGPCEGDSGGALTIQLGVGVSRWFLRGIVSFSPKGKSSICDLDNYSVYTDVAKYMDWINNAMQT